MESVVVDCGLDYGRDMLIMLHTLLHILFNFHDRRDATKDFQFRDEIIRYLYAIRTPFHTLFFFFREIFHWRKVVWKRLPDHRVVSDFDTRIRVQTTCARTICNGTSKVKYQKIHSDIQTQLDMFFCFLFVFAT